MSYGRVTISNAYSASQCAHDAVVIYLMRIKNIGLFIIINHPIRVTDACHEIQLPADPLLIWSMAQQAVRLLIFLQRIFQIYI